MILRSSTMEGSVATSGTKSQRRHTLPSSSSIFPIRVLLASYFVLAALADDPLINMYMRGSGDRVPGNFPYALHFVPDIPAWSTGELWFAVLSDTGLHDLQRQCGQDRSHPR
ncbi:hypothetical protein Naga_101618g1 [Nannochloropsis gaditana]|uniref:Uncharacterized protein n=1 Tax=Nannochloropsis gaditana TaxID=72520 RepID=W7THP3_9STRA|nr:hypothetical protein Naga_101618g1 [Nannochloropsis gaditana]